MKTTMIILALLTLIACAKPSQETVSETQGATEVVMVKPSQDTCLRIDSERDVDFMIKMETDFYLIQSGEVYYSDFKTIDKLATKTVSLGNYCELEIVDGQLITVTLAKPSTCGGAFQPRCPPPPPQSYPCGPNGQMCY